MIDQNRSTCTSYTGATVHDNGWAPRVPGPRVAERRQHGSLLPPNALQEVQHRAGGMRNSVVWPRGELPMRHFPGLFGLQKQEDKHKIVPNYPTVILYLEKRCR